jgi:hypothetical protein
MAAVAALSVGTGCFTYVPISTSITATGSDVRVRLSPEGSTELSRVMGASINSVDGRLTAVSPDSGIAIAAQWVQTVQGLRERWTGAPTFTFPRSYFSSVERRALDRRKSTVAAIAIVGAMAVVGTVAMRGGGSEGGRDPGGGTGVFRR